MYKLHWKIGAGVVVSFAMVAAVPAPAVVLTFDDAIPNVMSYGFDTDGDFYDDVVFRTTELAGFGTTGPSPHQVYVDGPGLEGSTDLHPAARVDFRGGATTSVSFGFALDELFDTAGRTATFALFDAANVSLGSTTVQAQKPPHIDAFIEGLVTLDFAGTAAYGLFDFSNYPDGRYFIDNFEGEFGAARPVPEPASVILLGLGSLGLAVRSKLTA